MSLGSLEVIQQEETTTLTSHLLGENAHLLIDYSCPHQDYSSVQTSYFENLSDLPHEVLALICKYLVEDKFSSSMASVIIPLLHVNKTLREKIYFNWFIWYDKIADLHHFVKSFMPDNYSTTCFAVLCDEKFRNIDLVVKRYDGNSSFYFSSESELTNQFVSFIETLCDVSMIQNLVIPIPLLSNNTNLQGRMLTWANHFPKVNNVTFLTARESVENASPKDLTNYIEDMNYYGKPTTDQIFNRFETLRDLKISSTVFAFENFIQTHSSEIEHLSALSSLVQSKKEDLGKISQILSTSQQLRGIELEGGLDISSPIIYNNIQTLSNRLTRLNLEISIQTLMSDTWKTLCSSLTCLKKLTLYIYSGEEDNEANTLTFSPSQVPLPRSLRHLGLNNFVDVPVHAILDGSFLPFLTYFHVYKLQLSITSNQKPFPILETFEYFPEKRDNNESDLIDFWMEKHSSLLNFSYSYDWDDNEKSSSKLIIKNHPSMKKLKIACSKTDIQIDRAPQHTTIIGIPNSLVLKGNYVKKLTFSYPNEGKIPHELRTYHIDLEKVDLLVVKMESKVAVSTVSFNATIGKLDQMHVYFNLNLAHVPEHDISPYIPRNASELSLQQIKLFFQDQIPPSVVDGLSESIHRFHRVDALSVNFEWLKTGLKGYTTNVEDLSVFNFFNVKTYVARDINNNRSISNQYLREMRVETDELGGLTAINNCTSLKQVHCTSANKYTPQPSTEKRIILDSKTSRSIEDIKMSFAIPALHDGFNLQNLKNLQLTDSIFTNLALNLHSLPSLKKLELSKIRDTLRLELGDETHHAIQHIYIDSVHTVAVDFNIVAPNLRSLTFTRINNCTESSRLSIKHAPKLIRKIIHLPNLVE
ncbi:hypothetical protein NAEGRDRAFT_80212 [Naegleria gruberi]|uniref:Uncharacterized protein n=1 Tax=Naegleria gruberi TaxID=5762 RepID=D2VJP9_NAEGR|nr:uncharacterized protein NAEGRDRAFT_80212 [Naegleria gruberi]EFC43069.1 hypothetical protein NAEGRDRAFT_80212 [Naegleria gruberi]|eukprot:XP_002675813.1 hypothetical protein NAEGRDRAFT_80212 [Naegleria gruberi strain NEG-M]